MFTHTPRRFLALSMVLLLLMTPLITTAASRKPLIEESSNAAVNEVAGHCGPEDGGFDILATYTIHFRDTYFFRADGTWDRLAEHETYRGTLTNSVTGKTYNEGPDAMMFRYDFADDGLATSWDTATITQITITGTDWHTNVVGQGRVVHDAGMLIVKQIDGVWTVVEWGGRHDVNMEYPRLFFEVYCPLLAAS